MAERVNRQKPNKLANIFTTGFDFSSISASSFDLNSFSSVKNSVILMKFTRNPRYSVCCLGVKTDFFRFPENLNLSATAMSTKYAPDIALGLLP